MSNFDSSMEKIQTLVDLLVADTDNGPTEKDRMIFAFGYMQAMMANMMADATPKGRKQMTEAIDARISLRVKVIGAQARQRLAA